MFTRRMFVALAVCLAVSASSAFANGNGNGTKKDSHILIKNESQHRLFAFVDVDADEIEEASFSEDPLDAFESLGGQLVESGDDADFSVKAGKHWVTVIDVDIDDEDEHAGPVFVDRKVSVSKGQTKKVFVHDSDIPVGTDS